MIHPIKARLKTYGFTWVQLDPRRPLEPWRWGLRSLQSQPCAGRWKSLLINCDSFERCSRKAVISPSLSWLEHLHKTNPQRPLIFCQTAYEPWPAKSRMKRLARGKPLPFLAQDDAVQPLFWLADHEPNLGLNATSWVNARLKQKVLRLWRKNHPKLDIWIQEDGLFAIQAALFHNNPRALKGESQLVNVIRDQQQTLATELRTLRGPSLVCGSNQNALDAFSQSLRAVRRGSYYLSYGLPPPRAEAWGPVLYFLKDSAMRWGHVNLRGWPLVHIDGDARRRAFRALRVSTPALPLWFWPGSVLGQAVWRSQGGVHVFQKTCSGWRLPVVMRTLNSLNEQLRQLLACYYGMPA